MEKCGLTYQGTWKMTGRLTQQTRDVIWYVLDRGAGRWTWLFHFVRAALSLCLSPRRCAGSAFKLPRGHAASVFRGCQRMEKLVSRRVNLQLEMAPT